MSTRFPKEKKCRHFNGVQNDACKVGVNYDVFRDDVPRPNGICLPCLGEDGAKDCPKYEIWTAEELKAQEEITRRTIECFTIARPAIITESLKLGFRMQSGRDGGKGVHGKIDPCPVCKTGVIHFSRAGYNGHVHASCSNSECVRWIE